MKIGRSETTSSSFCLLFSAYFSHSARDFSAQSRPVLAFGLGLQSQSRPSASTAKTQSHPVPASSQGLRPQSRPPAAELEASLSPLRHCVWLGYRVWHTGVSSSVCLYLRSVASAVKTRTGTMSRCILLPPFSETFTICLAGLKSDLMAPTMA